MNKVLVALAGVAAFTAAASGNVLLYDNGSFDGVNGYSGAFANDFVIADNGSFVEYATVEVLSNFNNNNTPAGSLNWRILEDNGGSPGAELAAGPSAIANPVLLQQGVFGGYNVWELTLDTGSVAVDAGVYWFEFTTDSNANVAFWVTAAGGGQYNQGSREHAFALYGVPTPGAAAVLGLGGLAAMRRRR